MTGDSKLEWLSANCRCPICATHPLIAVVDGLQCSSCEKVFPIVDGTVDFLDEETRDRFRIADTSNVSDHPFDGNAMTIIERCRVGGGMVLDCGSGYKAQTFPHVVQMEIVRYPHVDVLAVNQRLPFLDGSFDAVFSLDVLEHVNDPFASAREISRVLRPGGYLYVDLPFLQHEHGYPDHYFNATRSGLLTLFSGLGVLSHHVPKSGRAMHTVHSVLSAYTGGLPPAEQERFRRLTVGDIVGKSPVDWLDDPIGNDLAPNAQWALASTTQALMRKAPSGSPGDSRLSLSPHNLPGFPEFSSNPVPGRRPKSMRTRVANRLRRMAGPRQ